MLDLGQVVLVKRLLPSLKAVLGVGQNQGHQVPVQLIPNHMQVSQICRAHFVAGVGGLTEQSAERQNICKQDFFLVSGDYMVIKKVIFLSC